MKDRFSDAYGPKRLQPTALALHSEGVTKTLLDMAGQEVLSAAITPVHAEAAIENLLNAAHLLDGNTDFQDRIQRPSSANGR